MRISFWGAARTVTGSQFLVQTDHQRILIDCGMYQGSDHLRVQGRPEYHYDPSSVDFMLLTHAHIDHSGNIPLLVRSGFRGDIYTTGATVDLCRIMLADSAKIQMEDAEYDLRKWRDHGRVGPPPAPLYNMTDVQQAMEQFRSVKYDEFTELAPGVRARWIDAGHILGAASIELAVNETGHETRVAFSGDIGHPKRPLLRDPEFVEEADFVVMESTYGNRRHESREVKVGRLEQIIKHVTGDGGHLIIPSFAVGRTQEVLYELNQLVEGKRISPLPVYVDSPLAISATEISERHRECFDKETTALLESGDDPLEFPGLHFVRDVEGSKHLNTISSPMIIMAASGMCTGGRIRHHLHHHLTHPHDVVLFVGYQAAGTLGRIIQEGANKVKLYHDWVPVRAKIDTLHGFSAHADVDGLLNWLGHIKKPQGVFVVHGEEETSLDFAALAHQRLDAPAIVPEFGETFDLSDREALSREFAAMRENWQRRVDVR